MTESSAQAAGAPGGRQDGQPAGRDPAEVAVRHGAVGQPGHHQAGRGSQVLGQVWQLRHRGGSDQEEHRGASEADAERGQVC